MDTLPVQTFEHSSDVFVVGCGCPACQEASLDPQAGGTANNKPIWTPDQIAAYLNRSGTSWLTTGVQRGDANPTTINYGFFDTQAQLVNNGYVYFINGQGFGLNEYFGFGAFTVAQRDAARQAVGYWDDVIAISFVETSVNQADINFGNVMNRPGTQAYARLPGSSVSSNPTVNAQAYNIVGDIWVTGTEPTNFGLSVGQYGLNTLVHEFGHSLGLSHPGAYNFAPGFAVTYGNGAEYAQDARNYTIMSYWNPRDLGSTPTGVPTRDFDWSIMSIAYGATPMIHDILAVQKMYGADMTTRTGDTTYGFNSNAGRDAFDFTKNAWPTMTIWDAGGIDTLDASGYAVNQLIDLTPGSLSSIGGVTYEQAAATLTLESVNAKRASAGYAPITQATFNANMAALAANPNAGRLTDNVGIAYGVTVENAVGGSGADTIFGNGADNRLSGGAGSDQMWGRDGDDVLDGGTGADVLHGGVGNDLFLVDDAGDQTIESAGEGVDTVRASLDWTLGAHVENLELAGAARVGRGNALNNGVTGTNGDDRLYGEAGDDVLTGGNGVDQLWGGAGADRFVFGLETTRHDTKRGYASVDVIWDFNRAEGDKIDLSGLGLSWGGSGAPKAGSVTFQSLGTVNAAENVLGFDLPGLEKGDKSSVTLVYADVDGDGKADIVLALVGAGAVSSGDFIFGGG